MYRKRSSQQWLSSIVNLDVNEVARFCGSRNGRAVEGNNADIAADAACLDDGCPDINNSVCFEHDVTLSKKWLN